MSSNNFYQEYRNIDGQDYDISGYYEIGGTSYLGGRNVKRGYYLSVSKVKIEDGFVTMTIDFGANRTSTRYLLKEVNRKSKKAENEALKLITEDIIQELIDYLNPIKKEA